MLRQDLTVFEDTVYLLLPPPLLAPPPRDPMLEAPRLLLERARDPL